MENENDENNNLNYKEAVTLNSYIPGIFIGYFLLLFFQFFILFYYFSFNIFNLFSLNNKQFLSIKYLQASIISFITMIITGAILTIGWSHIDYQNNPLITWYGYNNICIVFDTPPSNYVMPTFWTFCAYYLIRFCVENSREVIKNKILSKNTKLYILIVNILSGFSSCFFSVCLAISPEFDMIAHTVPFITLLFCFPCLFISLLLQKEVYPISFRYGVIFFALTSSIKIGFVLYALSSRLYVHGYLPRIVDIIWTFSAIFGPLVLTNKFYQNITIENQKIHCKSIDIYWSKIYLIFPLFLIIIYQFFKHCFIFIYQHSFVVYFTNPNPNFSLKLPKVHDVEQPVGNGDNCNNIYSNNDFSKYQLANIPLHSNFIGNIWGEIKFYLYGHKLFWNQEHKVFGINIGQPVVYCGDILSSKIILQSSSTTDNFIYFDLKPTFGYSKQFYLNSFENNNNNEKKKRNDLFNSIYSFNKDSIEFIETINIIKDEFQKWCEFEFNILHSLSLQQHIENLLILSISKLIVGIPIEPILFKKSRVHFFENILNKNISEKFLPSYYSKNYLIHSLKLQIINTSPKWNELNEIFKKYSLSPFDGLDELLWGINHTINNLINNVMNIFMLLPFIKDRQILTQHMNNINNDQQFELFLTSFILEIQRFNSILIGKKLQNDTYIPSNSNSLYHLQSNTIVMTSSFLSQLDESIWIDSFHFKSNRFMISLSLQQSKQSLNEHDLNNNNNNNNNNGKSDNNENEIPLPILSFEYQSSNYLQLCPFMNISMIYLKELTRILITSYKWKLNSSIMKYLLKLQINSSSSILEFNFEPNNLKLDSILTPSIPSPSNYSTTTLTLFHSRF